MPKITLNTGEANVREMFIDTEKLMELTATELNYMNDERINGHLRDCINCDSERLGCIELIEMLKRVDFIRLITAFFCNNWHYIN